MNSRAAGKACVIGTLLVSVGAVAIAVTYPTITTASPYQQPAPVEVAPPPPPPRVMTLPQAPTFVPPVPTTIDTTHPPVFNNQIPGNGTDPGPQVHSMLDGINGLDNNKFPNLSDLTGSTDFITFHTTPSSNYKQLSSYAVELSDGDAMGSVRAPSTCGMIETPHGQVALFKSSDVLVHVDHTHSTTVRVLNLTGGENKIQVKLNKDIVGDASNTNTFSVAPGMELVCCEHKLDRSQLRPNDGFSRRRVQVLGNGNIALCEVSIESVLDASALIAQMTSTNDEKDKRVLKDLSRMAAVLNNANGTQGFTKQ